MSRIYLDACSIIYYIETGGGFHDAIVKRLMRVQKDPGARLLISRLSCRECVFTRFETNDQDLLAIYDSFFSTSRLILLEISGAVIKRATLLRAKYAFKTADAIHLASAIESAADLFVTGDASLARCPDLVVEVLGDG